MRRDKATPGARQEFHFLWEESVWVERRGGNCWENLSEPVSNAPCFCLLTRDSVGEEEKKKNGRNGTVLWGEAVRRDRGNVGHQQGKITATYRREPNHCWRTDRHTRRSAVLTIICGGRAVGAGCNSNHNNNNNQKEGSVKLQRAPQELKKKIQINKTSLCPRGARAGNK